MRGELASRRVGDSRLRCLPRASLRERLASRQRVPSSSRKARCAACAGDAYGEYFSAVTPPPLRIQLQGQLKLDSVDQLIASLTPLIEVDQPTLVDLDLSRVQFITPAAMTVIHAVMKRAADQGLIADGSRCTVDPASACSGYLRRMDVFKGLVDFPDPEPFLRRPPRGFAPLSRFGDQSAAETVASDLTLAALFAREDDKAKLAGPIKRELVELAENCVQHSGETPGAGAGVACAQLWSRLCLVELAVLDCGVGIAASMRRNPEYKGLPDHELMQLALNKYETGVGLDTRGTGLWGLCQAVIRNGGKFVVFSGPYRIDHQGFNGHQVGESGVHWPGTLAVVQINTDKPLEFEKGVSPTSFPSQDGVFFN